MLLLKKDESNIIFSIFKPIFIKYSMFLIKSLVVILISLCYPNLDYDYV